VARDQIGFRVRCRRGAANEAGGKQSKQKVGPKGKNSVTATTGNDSVPRMLDQQVLNRARDSLNELSVEPKGRFLAWASRVRRIIDHLDQAPRRGGRRHGSEWCELENLVAENGIFSRCMATNLTQYALAEAQSPSRRTTAQLSKFTISFSPPTRASSP